MKQLLLALSLVFIAMGTEAFSAPWITPTAKVLCPDTTCTTYSTDPTADESSSGGVLILAKSQDFFKCIEQCSKDHYNCEKSNKEKNKPGTKKNWEESGKCQVKKEDCLNKCQ